MNIKSLRTEKRLSQEDLALEAGLHRTFVAHVERGVRNISIDNIEKLAKALDVSVQVLLTENNSKGAFLPGSVNIHAEQ